MMTLTAEEYAEIIIKKSYKVETSYNLARAIARVADKYAKWASTAEQRATAETIDPYAYQKQYEADTKREAYRLALLMLVDKFRE